MRFGKTSADQLILRTIIKKSQVKEFNLSKILKIYMIFLIKHSLTISKSTILPIKYEVKIVVLH